MRSYILLSRIVGFATAAIPATDAAPPVPIDVVPAIVARITKREGGNVPGTLPSTHNNPCSLIFAHQPGASRGSAYGEGNFARFPSRDSGLRACERDVRKKLREGVPLSVGWGYMR